ncbi:hypothetical protein [Leifsonia shinshuensis]|uniref:Uncharacterized protein n=1 Tax=Leifsonia shinshuensis TaxID=150026 RepID=A0A7G6YA63_9MICO|nr:hypothetical protein [Leifsonia shinshuensis]QNE35378.1 hypothetical protein F1C12_09710 [Leifsonia shinshuensis]
MGEMLDRTLQVLAVLVPIVALIQARRTPGRRYAERARISLELAAGLEAAGKGEPPTWQATDRNESVARLRDDARFNAARYLHAGTSLGLRAPLIMTASFYTVAFGWMGVSDLVGTPTRSDVWAGTVLLGLSGAAFITFLIGLRRRYLEHSARRAAGLPVTTTVSEMRDAARIIRNRLVIAQHRRRPQAETKPLLTVRPAAPQKASGRPRRRQRDTATAS